MCCQPAHRCLITPSQSPANWSGPDRKSAPRNKNSPEGLFLQIASCGYEERGVSDADGDTAGASEGAADALGSVETEQEFGDTLRLLAMRKLESPLLT